LLRDYEMACHDLASHPGDARILDRVATLAHQLEATGAWDPRNKRTDSSKSTRNQRYRGANGGAIWRRTQAGRARSRAGLASSPADAG
jgi:hypothetical protein